MTEALKNQTLREALLAVADGEADAAQRELAFTALAEKPELARFVLNQQRLRESLRRTMTLTVAPAGLREKIAAQLPATTSTAAPPKPAAPPSDDSAAPLPPLARLGPWLPAAVAASLCIVAAGMFLSTRIAERTTVGPAALSHPANPPATPDDSQVVTIDVIESLAGRHVSCSRLISSLNDSVAFPTEVKDVPGAIKEYLGRSPYGVLDLSALGYKFDGAGPCAAPGSKSVHLLFRPIDRKQRDDALSLWIQADDGSVKIKPDTIYHQGGEFAAHPIVLWKHGDMIYYLVGDESEIVTKAAEMLSKSI